MARGHASVRGIVRMAGASSPPSSVFTTPVAVPAPPSGGAPSGPPDRREDVGDELAVMPGLLNLLSSIHLPCSPECTSAGCWRDRGGLLAAVPEFPGGVVPQQHRQSQRDVQTQA